MSIIQIDDLWVRGVVADHDIQITIPVDVHELPGIRAVGRGTKIIASHKMASTVAEEDTVYQRPVAALHEHHVQVAVSIDITDTEVGRGLGGRLKQEGAIE
jgi:hypothetical protein